MVISRETSDIIIGAVAKIYLAELIEEARSIMASDEENILPEHLEMAFLRLNNAGKFNFGEMDLKNLFQD